MTWSPTPTTPERQYRTAWFLAPPAPDPREYQPAWFPRYRIKPSDTGIGQDLATSAPRILGADTGLGADRAVLTPTGLLIADTGLGADGGLIVPDFHATDAGAGADIARPGVRPADTGLGADLGQMRPRCAAIDRAVGVDMLTSLKPRTTARDTGLGADSASSGFTAIAPVAANWAAAGTYTFKIPVGCRYIDVVLLGAGGGGASSGTFYTLKGYPGEAGSWSTITLERGVHIPWTAITLTVVIGTGGARGSGGVTGTPGSAGAATVLKLDTATLLTATGGTGGIANATGTFDNVGRSPGSVTYNSQPYVAGGTQSANGGAGNPPGGGGAGGSNFGGAGGVGAPGGAWCRAYQ